MMEHGGHENGSSKSKSNSEVIITAKELKELRRVYDKLCFFADKSPKLERLNVIQSQLSEIQRPESGIGQELVISNASATISQDVQSMVETLKEEEAIILDELNQIRSRTEQYIRPQDAGVAMKFLGKRMSKREINDIIWEVDEKIDGVIDWEEFSLMFERNLKDVSGLEPASFYHMVQFMIYDRDSNGKVSIDETMNMLYARVGRAKMESTITKLFGGEDGAPIKEEGQQGGEIDFKRYLDVVEKEQVKIFNESELGRTLAEKKTKKKTALQQDKSTISKR